MERKPLGRTGVSVSSLCFGTMSFGTTADEAESGRMYAACRDAGVDFFDTANIYGQGASEEILGRLMASERDGLIIATKGHGRTGPGANDVGASRRHLRASVHASLKRLGTDRIDVYYVHMFDPRTPIDETLRALEEMVHEGSILYPALSNWAAWQVAKALGIQERFGWARLQALQPMYNLAKRQAEVEILPMAQAEGLAVMPYSPMGGGLLSGKYGVDRRPGSGRLVENSNYATRYGHPDHARIAESFTEHAASLGMHPATLAVAWVASHPGVTAPILGARSVEQLRPSLAAAEVQLTEEQRAAVTALTPEVPLAHDRREEDPAHARPR